MTIDELKAAAAAVAQQMQAAGDGALPLDVRNRFITVRSELFVRGVYDPVLVRFDSATAPHASAREVAEQLGKVAASLR